MSDAAAALADANAPASSSSTSAAAPAAAAAAPPPAPARKRTVAGPRDGFTLTDVKPQTVTAIPYDIVKDAKI